MHLPLYLTSNLVVQAYEFMSQMCKEFDAAMWIDVAYKETFGLQRARHVRGFTQQIQMLLKLPVKKI